MGPAIITKIMAPTIRPCTEADLPTLLTLINTAAEAYRGVIPPDRYPTPYMPEAELRHEIAQGVQFWGFDQDDALLGIMGLQPVEDVTLIRHAYVRPDQQHRGIGTHLLRHLRSLTPGPLLVGTWADADWAIRFYQRHGFHLVPPTEKAVLLRRYWRIPDRQIETSVVLTTHPVAS